MTLETAKNVGLLVSLALILLALVFAKVLIGNLAKVFAALLLVAGSIAVWTQRESIQECADDFERQTNPALPDRTVTCQAFGLDVDIQL